MIHPFTLISCRNHPGRSLVRVDPYHSSSQADSVCHRAGDHTRPIRHIKNVLAGSNLNRIRDPFRPLEKQRWKVELLIDLSGVTRQLPHVVIVGSFVVRSHTLTPGTGYLLPVTSHRPLGESAMSKTSPYGSGEQLRPTYDHCRDLA